MIHNAERSKRFLLPFAPLAWATAGPLALGAVTGLRFSGQAVLMVGAGTVAIALGVLTMMGPALHLLLALIGTPTTGAQLRDHIAHAAGAAGRVQVGFAPAALFLSATAVHRHIGVLLVVVALIAGALVGGLRLVRDLGTEVGWRTAAPPVVVWSAIALIVAGRLTHDLLDTTLFATWGTP